MTISRKIFPYANPTLNKNDGFSLVGAIVALLVCTLIFFANLKLQVFQIQQLESSDTSVTSSLILQNSLEMLKNKTIMVRLLSTKMVDGGNINQGSHNESMKCILSTKNGGGVSCDHHKVPSSNFTPSKCENFSHIDQKKLCWIRENLAFHQVTIIPHPDPGSTADDFLYSMRLEHNGMTHDFEVCENFDMNSGGNFNCVFRIRYFAWVECDGGVSSCGGNTGVGGQIKMAAIPERRDSQGVFNALRYSILDFPVGAL